MDDGFKKWLCEKGCSLYTYGLYDKMLTDAQLAILIKAMWAVNREGKGIEINLESERVYVSLIQDHDYFYFKDHNNSEQEALTKALEYVWKQGDK